MIKKSLLGLFLLGLITFSGAVELNYAQNKDCKSYNNIVQNISSSIVHISTQKNQL